MFNIISFISYNTIYHCKHLYISVAILTSTKDKMKETAFYLFLFLSQGIAATGNEGYSKDELFRLIPEDEEQLEVVKTLESLLPVPVDVWKAPDYPGDFMDVQVPKEDVEPFTSSLQASGIQFEVKSKDVQSLVGEHLYLQHLAADTSPLLIDSYNYTYYLPYDDLMKWVDALLDYCQNTSVTCEKFNVGKSYEERDMTGIKISTHGSKKRGFWIDGGKFLLEFWESSTKIYFKPTLVF